MKILLIEDNPGDVVLLREMLKEQDCLHELIVTDKLVHGLSLLASAKPDLILLDLLLPDSNGIETFKRMYALAIDIPIILLTGNMDQSIARSAVQEGAQDFLVKGTFDGKTLNRSIAYSIERKQVEIRAQQHQQTIARMERLNSMGEIALTLAHELNQPLAAIAAYAQGCVRALRSDDERMKEEVINRLQMIAEQAERAGTIVHRLKNFTHQGELTYNTIDLNVFLKDIVCLLQLDIQKASINIEWELAEQLPLLNVDTTQLQQVILNLVRNSIEALASSNNRSSIISIRTTNVSNNSIQIDIRDNGPGFPPEKAMRLFEPYFTTKKMGTGIGLAICRTIIEAHGGFIQAQQNLPAGAWFQFTLPINR